MTYVVHRPAAPLDRYLDCLWYADLSVPYQREKILPGAAVELIINFGGSFHLHDRENPAHYSIQSASWLVGLHTVYLLNEPQAETHMIGARFKPGGLYPFLPVEAAELHNRVLDGSSLWGRWIDEARERLYLAGTLTARFALLEKLLLERLHHNEKAATEIRVSLVQRGVAEIAHYNGVISMQALSHRLGISQKHLITCFKHIVGVSPKTMARLYRFQHALHIIDPAHPMDWAALAQDALYYDQAHFSKDFAAFAALSPSAYLDLRRAAFGADLAQGEDVHFVPLPQHRHGG